MANAAPCLAQLSETLSTELLLLACAVSRLCILQICKVNPTPQHSFGGKNANHVTPRASWQKQGVDCAVVQQQLAQAITRAKDEASLACSYSSWRDADYVFASFTRMSTNEAHDQRFPPTWAGWAHQAAKSGA
eukprot:2114181-Amphidinium_carterae.1